MIYHEYAIEPTVLANFEDFQYFLGQLSIHEGRVVAVFPKSWQREVHTALGHQLTDGQKKTVEVLFSRLKKEGAIRRSVPFDSEQDWISNALMIDSVDPFAQIVSTTDQSSERVVVFTDAKNQEFWDTRRDEDVERNSTAIASCLKTLLRDASKIQLADAHFAPWRDEYWRSIKALVESSERAKVVLECHVDTLNSDLCGVSRDKFHREAKMKAAEFLPSGQAITFFGWEGAIVDRRTFHHRVIMTEKGGVTSDYGISEFNTSVKTKIQVLSKHGWQDELRKFDPSSSQGQHPEGWALKYKVTIE